MGRVIYGLVGHQIGNSLSPAIFRAAFAASGIEADYQLSDISHKDTEKLANFCYEVDTNNIAGFSVTIPYKQAIMAYIDHYDTLAKTIGAVNTVNIERDEKSIRGNGHGGLASRSSRRDVDKGFGEGGPLLIGYNTDATGAMAALNEKIKTPGKRALVLGNGGAARAIVYALKESGADVHIWGRNKEKATEIADTFDVNAIEYRMIKREANFDIIVNATSVGNAPMTSESLLCAEQIRPGSLVMELVTDPLVTQLLHEAKKAGAETLSGDRMLLYQAIGQFEIWFKKTAPIKAMEKAIYEKIKKQQC